MTTANTLQIGLAPQCGRAPRYQEKDLEGSQGKGGKCLALKGSIGARVQST